MSGNSFGKNGTHARKHLGATSLCSIFAISRPTSHVQTGCRTCRNREQSGISTKDHSARRGTPKFLRRRCRPFSQVTLVPINGVPMGTYESRLGVRVLQVLNSSRNGEGSFAIAGRLSNPLDRRRSVGTMASLPAVQLHY